MPLKKTYPKKRFGKKYYKRKKNKYSIPYRRSKIGSMVHYFKRSTDNFSNMAAPVASAGTIVQSGTSRVWTYTTPAAIGDYYFSMGIPFSLNDLYGVTEFQALFDLYQITGVQFRIVPFANSSQTANASGTSTMGCFVHSALDFDDTNAPTASYVGAQNLKELATYRVKNMAGTRVLKRYFKPRTTNYVNVAAGTAYVALAPKQWINSANINAIYNGLKIVFQIRSESAVALNYSFKLEATYYLKFKYPI